ncbi:MAG TPA: DUF4445 domain-containing protein [Dehalococcoidia bacterium]|nr:DUF4445 domain-containing protein [Dehalococcoidia bacterium]
MTRHLVVFQPSGKRGRIRRGSSILEAARGLGVDLETICGGRQTCGKCRVRVEEGSRSALGISSGRRHLSPPTEREWELLGEMAIAQGYRLACAATIQGDLHLFVPEGSRAVRQVVPKTTIQRAIPLKPALRRCYVELPPPSLEDPRGDWERLSQELGRNFGLAGLDIDYQVLGRLAQELRSGDWKVTVTVWHDREVVKVEPGLVDKSYGLALDIGTTTLAGYLCDLSSGQVMAAGAALNPQVSYGEDVVSRIAYAMETPQGLDRLHDVVVEALNDMVRNLVGEVGLAAEDISEVTVVGNTAMHHLFLRLDPRHLGRIPFAPTLHRPLDIKARDLGLRVHPAANVHVLPIEAGFVGADNVAVLIAEEPYNQEEMALIVDIGTNGELVLGNRQRLLSASCATGPAFEGAHIRFGMRAAPGAIEKVSIDPHSLEVGFKVVGEERWSGERPEVKARGICGSGIIDAVAEMLKAGIIKPNGTFNRDISSPRLLLGGTEPEFVIARAQESALGREITVSQGDVRAVQLAKGALYSGARVLMAKLGIQRVDKVVLAGSFGLSIDREKALTLGLFPYCEPERVHCVGNAAGEGARLALINVDKRREAAEVARWVEYVELTLEPSFPEEFAAAMAFPAP